MSIEGGFTYDLSTDIGKMRLLIADTDESAAAFWDNELETFLSFASGDIWEASALASEAWARNRAKLDLMMRQQGISSQREASTVLLELAQNIRTQRPGSPGGVSVVALTADGDYRKNIRPLGSIKQDRLKEYY